MDLCERLEQLSQAVVAGKESVAREFYMSIPARSELLEQIEQLQAENQRLRDGLGELIDKPVYTNLSGRIVPEGIVYAIKQLLEGGVK